MNAGGNHISHCENIQCFANVNVSKHPIVATGQTLTVAGSGITTLGTGAFTIKSAITANTGYTLPTAKTQLGCLITESSTTNNTSTNVLVTGVMTNIAFYNIGIGTWIVSASYFPSIASTPASVSNQQLILNTTSASGSGYRSISTNTAPLTTPSNISSLSVSAVISSTSSGTNIYLEYAISLVGGSVQIGTSGTNYVFTATRIA